MQFSLDSGIGAYHIKAYEVGRITVNNQVIDHSIIISPNQLIESWRPQRFTELQSSDFTPILQFKPLPEVVLLGTGEVLSFPPQEILLPITQQGIGIEVMNTAAACRTYCALMAEGRHVVAALIIA